MLPKVTTALSQFIKPISSSTQQQTVVEKRHKEEKKNFQKFNAKSEPKPDLKLVKSTDQNNPVTTAKADLAQKLSVANSFLQLLTVIQKRHHLLNCWKGIQTYFAMSKSSKKASKFRKGTLIDSRVE
jgi:hypothetical protein